MHRRCRLPLSPPSGSASRSRMGRLNSPMRRRTGWICGMNLRDYDVRFKRRIGVWKNWRGLLGGCSRQSRQHLRRRREMDGWRLLLEACCWFFLFFFSSFVSLLYHACGHSFYIQNTVMPMSAASIRLGCLKNVCYFGRIWWLLTEYHGVLLERSLVLFFVLLRMAVLL